ncbi:MAG: shikimate kinase [Verrucomicrobia bacterium]|nr:shikimate kinase [Verrucomicrobiota bacterium]
MKSDQNIVLIGMPGSGKSTVGVILAKQASCGFLDTDVLIQVSEDRSLQQILDTEGHLALRHIEERILLTVDLENHVIATGGSAAYSDAAMRHLGCNGVIVFLDTALTTLEARIHNFSTRGIAKRPDQSFDDLFQERLLLYNRYADLTIPCDGLGQEEIAGRILDAV